MENYSHVPPYIDSTIEQYYFAKSDIDNTRINPDFTLLFPYLLLSYSVRYYDKKRNIDKTIHEWAISQKPDTFGKINWEKNQIIDQSKIKTEWKYSCSKNYKTLVSGFGKISE